MSSPVALVTGASSGIGLALTKHLLSKQWHVAMADVNPPKEDLPNTIFLKTDVSSWEQNATTFQKAFEWHSRLDFVALNAGIDDRDDIFNSISSDSTKPPRQPNMKTLEVNLFGPYYGLKLAAHYMTLNTPSAGGKVVITASSAGLYALPTVPQYTAAKHALVGLTRSLAPLAAQVGITVNAICPALVRTGLAPPGLMDNFSEEMVTPMSTITRAFDELGDLDRVREEGWRKGGPNGQIVECALGNLYYRDEIEKADASQEHMAVGAADAWAKAYTERNKNFAMQDWMSGNGDGK